MKLEINNLLEVSEIIIALETRIENIKEVYGVGSATEYAIMNTYNQVKARYKDTFNFKF